MAPYATLDQTKREIRVLLIQPGNWDDPINCSLETVSLACNPHYEALSYVWGDPHVTESIRMDGAEVQITINLNDALRRLRTTHRTRTVWVDALCINQQDDQE